MWTKLEESKLYWNGENLFVFVFVFVIVIVIVIVIGLN